MTDAISKSAFAAHRGVGTSAVSNWIARGQLAGAALTEDGQINVEEADRQLGVAVDPGRGAPAAGASASRGQGQEDDTAATLAQIRLRKETLALEQQERSAALDRGELMRVDDARRAWASELDDLVAATELFVVELPVKLGLTGRESVEIARREWRAFRARRAEQADHDRAA
jgi:hypothetical protein